MHASVGLDPPTLRTLSPLLHNLAKTQSPRLLLALRPQDVLPEWITHLIYIGRDLRVDFQGTKEEVLEQIRAVNRASSKGFSENFDQSTRGGGTDASSFMSEYDVINKDRIRTPRLQGLSPNYTAKYSELPSYSREGIPLHKTAMHNIEPPRIGEVIVEMENVIVKYGEKQVLGGWKQHVDGHIKEGLWWTVRRGERWGIFGPNGSFYNSAIVIICND